MHLDAEAFNAALHGYRDARQTPFPVTRHEREQRRAAVNGKTCAALSALTAARCTCCRSSPPAHRHQHTGHWGHCDEVQGFAVAGPERCSNAGVSPAAA
jgi:hypothetical protein